jgi:hypothetical protein
LALYNENEDDDEYEKNGGMLPNLVLVLLLVLDTNILREVRYSLVVTLPLTPSMLSSPLPASLINTS